MNFKIEYKSPYICLSPSHNQCLVGMWVHGGNLLRSVDLNQQTTIKQKEEKTYMGGFLFAHTLVMLMHKRVLFLLNLITCINKNIRRMRVRIKG